LIRLPAQDVGLIRLPAYDVWWTCARAALPPAAARLLSRSSMPVNPTLALTAALAVVLLAPPPARASAAPGEEPEADHAERIAVDAPSRRRGAAVARIVAPTFARARLKRRRGWPVSLQTAWSGQPQQLLVLDAATREGRDWVKVLLPQRPNGSAGWVPRDRVVLGRTPYWVQVRTAARRVTVYRNGKRVRTFKAVVGARSTPTPHGLAAIYERNRQPNPRGFLGPWALPLTVHSNVLMNFGGGPGRVGIHGRAGASLRDPLGTARSHGCIRINNHHVAWMAAKLPAGTPVRLRR
jgi:lipoprotein-anchoring transpeptidase ErfK/SrfK